MSEHLRNNNIPHLILERWRTGRWDSLVANGPAWHDRFPNLEFKGWILTFFPTRNAWRIISLNMPG